MGQQGEILLEVVSQRLQYIGRTLLTPHPFAIRRGQTYVVVGENGSGKSTLAQIIERGWNIGMNRILGDKRSLKIKSIEFSDIHSLTGFSDSYYQQRFESMSSDGIPTIEELVGNKFTPERWDELCRQLSISDILHKRVNFLSSGELRKFLIINMFTIRPDILIVDNPYIGLDTRSRDLLNEMLQRIASQGTAVVLLLCNTVDIPQFTDFVLPLKRMEVGQMITYSPSLKSRIDDLFETKGGLEYMPDIATRAQGSSYKIAFELRHCNVSYGSTTIFSDVNWRVAAGERWALLGENGSGKSTLLSLVYADNPQGYRNDITLFDRRRGTGESIWDIKRHIGYISPEMHLYFDSGVNALTVVATGLRDTLGCFGRIDDNMKSLARQWMDTLGIGHLGERQLNTLSSGEQRLTLIARTFIKNASLLILDEPLHGLDQCQKRLVAGIIGRILEQPGRSIVYVTHYESEIPKMIGNVFRLSRP